VIVVDASIASEILLSLEGAAAALERLFGTIEVLHAPQLFDAEVAHVIRGAWLDHDINDEAAAMAISFLQAFPVMRHSHRPLLQRVWALRNNVSAYDAMYVALAELLDVPLITRDRRLARSSGHTARIEFIE
jgi:predicted nucleic acid-binding protein